MDETARIEAFVVEYRECHEIIEKIFSTTCSRDKQKILTEPHYCEDLLSQKEASIRKLENSSYFSKSDDEEFSSGLEKLIIYSRELRRNLRRI